MKVSVRVSKSFKAGAKPLLRKYPSLNNDLLKLEKQLLAEPTLGTSLGKGIYKIRLKITSKGKGKSGGASVISLLETTLIGELEILEEETVVNLIAVYDKSEMDTISEKELKALIKIFKQE